MEYTVVEEWDYHSSLASDITFRLRLLTPTQRAECTQVTVVDGKTIITPRMDLLIKYGVVKIVNLIINKQEIESGTAFNITPLTSQLQDIYDDVAIEVMTKSREENTKNS